MLPNEPLQPTSDGSSLVIRGMGDGVAGVVGTEPADHDVRRLDIPVDQITSVRLAERVRSGHPRPTAARGACARRGRRAASMATASCSIPRRNVSGGVDANPRSRPFAVGRPR